MKQSLLEVCRICVFSLSIIGVGLLATGCSFSETSTVSGNTTSEQTNKPVSTSTYSVYESIETPAQDEDWSDREDTTDYDCADFSSQSEAQDYFDEQGGSRYINVDDLDRDHDGIACEALR